MKFSLVTLYIKDMEPSLRFYRDALGMREVRRFKTPTGEIAFLSHGDGAQLELIASAAADVNYAGFSIGFDVDDIEAASKLLEQSCAKKLRGPIAAGGETQLAFFEGPSGEEVELIQH